MRSIVVSAAAAYLMMSASEAYANCVLVESDLDRLACYDKEAGRAPKVEALPVATGNWTVQKETSKLTDQDTVVVMLKSDETINCGWNRGKQISLVARCMEDKTVIYFGTDCHMASGHGGYGEITYRIDTEKARKVEGDASTDNKALGLWSGGQAIPVLKQMIGKSQMVVRMTPFSESPFTATFDIRGLDSAIKPLRDACRW